MRSRVLIVGCGDVGQRLGLRLAARGCQVFGLRRQVERVTAPIQGVAADITDVASLEVLRDSGPFDYLVVTTAAGRSGEAGYRDVYLRGLDNILALFANRPLRHMFLASSTSVYHQDDGSWVDERSMTAPTGYAGQIMLEAEARLAACGQAATVVRFGGIYGPGRTRLLSRLREGIVPAAGNNYSNRIHADDCAGVLAHLIAMAECGEALADCYLAVDHAPTPLREVCHWLARQCDIEVGSLREEGGLQRGGNKRCSNRRLLAAGYRFQYPDYRAGFTALMAEVSGGAPPG